MRNKNDAKKANAVRDPRHLKFKTLSTTLTIVVIVGILLLAVAEKRGGMKLGLFDAYINVIGGLRLDEPGADLPVVLAIASSYREQAIADDLAAIGEIGLTGEIRAVSNLTQRLAEVSRLGFKKCIIPYKTPKKLEIPEGLTVYRVKNLREAIEIAM